MSRSNIWEVTTFSDLGTVLKSNVTVILGLTIASTPNSTKAMIRKFLKKKSIKFPLLTFVYMEVTREIMGKLNILKNNPESYPIIHHIRNGNTILLTVENADQEGVYESFASV